MSSLHIREHIKLNLIIKRKEILKDYTEYHNRGVLCSYIPFSAQSYKIKTQCNSVLSVVNKSEATFAGRHLEMIDIAFDRHLDSTGQRLEYSFYLMMFILSFCLDIEIHLSRIAQ